MRHRTSERPCAGRAALQEHRHRQARSRGSRAPLAPDGARVVAQQRMHPPLGGAHWNGDTRTRLAASSRTSARVRRITSVCAIVGCDAPDAAKAPRTPPSLPVCGVAVSKTTWRAQAASAAAAVRRSVLEPRLCASSTISTSHGAPVAAASTSGCFTKSIDAIAVDATRPRVHVGRHRAPGIAQPRRIEDADAEAEQPFELRVPLVAKAGGRQDEHAAWPRLSRATPPRRFPPGSVLPRPTASASSTALACPVQQRGGGRPLPRHQREVGPEQVAGATSNACREPRQREPRARLRDAARTPSSSPAHWRDAIERHDRARAERPRLGRSRTGVSVTTWHAA